MKRIKTESKSLSTGKFITIVIAVTVLLVSLIFAVAVNMLNKPASNGSTNVDINTELTVRSVTGNTVEQDKKDAVNRVTELLKAAAISPTGVDDGKRLEELDAGNMKVIDSSLLKLIHFGPEATEESKINTFQTLITISTIIKTSASNGVIAPYLEDSWKASYADPEIGTVFVPLDVYTGGGAYFSFEMVYVDGNWKLAPYSLVDAVRLSIGIQSQYENGTNG